MVVALEVIAVVVEVPIGMVFIRSILSYIKLHNGSEANVKRTLKLIAWDKCTLSLSY